MLLRPAGVLRGDTVMIHVFVGGTDIIGCFAACCSDTAGVPWGDTVMIHVFVGRHG